MSQGAAMIFGKDAVIDQYNDYALDCWAIYQGKMRVKKGDDAEDLTGLLEKLGATPSNALYTLKVYDTGDLATITDKTEPAGSVNFKLFSAMMSGFGGGGNDMLNARLAAIEHKLDGEGSRSKDKKKTFGDVLMGWLENPDDLATVIGAVKMITGGQAPAVAGFKVAQVEDDPAHGVPQSEQQLVRLEHALDKLEKADPKIVSHLEQLAKIAESEPGKFAFMIKALDTGL